MNPANNSLERTYLIGGPPRIGKSILSERLSEKINGHVVGTDSIRLAAKKANQDKDSDLFLLNRLSELNEEEWLVAHEDPEVVIDLQNRESVAFHDSVLGFMNSFCDDDMNHIVEGVAILPEFVHNLEHKPKNVIFIGNTSEDAYERIKKYADENPEKDWMPAMGYSDERIKAVAAYLPQMSKFFKDQAEKYGFTFVDFAGKDFDTAISEAVDELTSD